MEINLNRLRAFYLAVREKSITRAAEQLYVTQPAVSMQIKLLEEDLKIKLFKKRGKIIELTEAGNELFSYAEKIFELVDEMEQVMVRHSSLSKGCLLIGTTRSFARHLMPELLSRFQEEFPGIKVSLMVGSSKEIADHLLKFRCDLGVIGKLSHENKLQTIDYSKEEFRLVVSKDHAFAARKSLSLKELENEPIIIREEGSSSRDLIHSILRENGITPSVLIEAGSVEFIKEYVAKGRGISFLYLKEIERELKKGLLSSPNLKEGPILLQTVIAFPRKHELSPSARALLKTALGGKVR
ncbi:MAG TPA: LysR family transcriptional regulator [Candidatus Marinimicrobia bacterium]|nr:LysR family transcriptional regulator [Candidatus Neomarinimicrobiota bacterium]